ncbi:hypothetical protein [Agathobaculum sp. Marseille-P7918]|uniref:hypothetical protein n=1 Tax=Agathobaculum sp. Marseille-P7918 TaxID=2479843 RepID=UPI000F6355F2|nr:hypothetical protein [Agathobaculum sp. Marseille-P7918]
MQEEKSFVYTMILGICMLLCLMMIGRMLLGHPEQSALPETENPTTPEQEETGMELRESDLCSLIEQALPVPVQEVTAKIGADQTISVVVLVSKQSLQDSGLVPGGLRTALLYLPDTCRLYGAWTASVTEGKLVLQCQSAEIGSITVPAEMVSTLTDQLSASLNAYFTDAEITPETVIWQDGVLRLNE